MTGTVLNLRALSPQVPAEFADVYDAATYRRSQEYTRARTRLPTFLSPSLIAPIRRTSMRTDE